MNTREYKIKTNNFVNFSVYFRFISIPGLQHGQIFPVPYFFNGLGPIIRMNYRPSCGPKFLNIFLQYYHYQ